MRQDITQQLQSVFSTLADALGFAPAWVVSLLILAGAMIVAWLLHAAMLALVERLLRGQSYWYSILKATKEPTRLAFLLVAFAVALPTSPLDPGTKAIFARLLGLATICLLGWMAIAALHIAANIYLMGFGTDVQDNLLARKHITQVRVLLRVMDTIIVLVTAGFALMTFDAVRQYGVSLFASAGVAGVVFGLAAQPVLSNLIAGVQLAITQPIRIEDAVTVQNEYGWIEEITATYVVIRLWDLRRLIVPLNFFIQQPFYNWTREAAATMGSVLLYLDYAAPVDVVRKKAADLVAETNKDNAKVVSVQVTNTSAEAIEVRILVSSNSAATTGDVCADLREKLIAFLQQQYPEALPRRRNEIVDPSARKAGGSPAPRPV